MADILNKFLGLEKSAQELVENAEKQAEGMITRAKNSIQEEYKARTAQARQEAADKILENQTKTLGLKEKDLEEYERGLGGIPQDQESLKKVVNTILFKANAAGK